MIKYQHCENCKTRVYMPDVAFVMSCNTCRTAKEQHENATAKTFNEALSGTGFYMAKPTLGLAK